MKFLIGIACLLGMMSMPIVENSQTNEVSISNTQTAKKLEVPETQTVEYTYADEGGTYIITLSSAEEATITATKASGETTTFTCTYTLEGSKLSLSYEGELWAEFTINEDNSLTLIENPGILDIDQIDLKEEVSNLQALIEALKQELEAETFNADNIAKILIAMGGTLGSILLVLGVKLVKTKIKNLKNDEEYQKAKQAMAEEFAKYQSEVKELISSLEDKVVKKIDDTEEKRQLQIEAQSLALTDKIEEAKKNLSIDEILEEN